MIPETLLNIRNIFRVAFLSCSHIRLEMCSEAYRAGLRFLFVPLVFVLRDNIRYVITAGQLCQQLFYFLLGTDLRKSLFPAVPRENLLLLCYCFSAAKCIVPLRPGLCKHFFHVFYFPSFCANSGIYLTNKDGHSMANVTGIHRQMTLSAAMCCPGSCRLFLP